MDHEHGGVGGPVRVASGVKLVSRSIAPPGPASTRFPFRAPAASAVSDVGAGGPAPKKNFGYLPTNAGNVQVQYGWAFGA